MVINITSYLPYLFLLGSAVLFYKNRGIPSFLMLFGFALLVLVDLHWLWGETHQMVQQADGSYLPSPEGMQTGQLLSNIAAAGSVVSSIGFLIFALSQKGSNETDS